MDKREKEDGGMEGGREGERALGGPWGFTEAEFDEPFTPYFQRHVSIIFLAIFSRLENLLSYIYSKTGARWTKEKAFAKKVFTNQERMSEVRSRSDTFVVSTVNGAN